MPALAEMQIVTNIAGVQYYVEHSRGELWTGRQAGGRGCHVPCSSGMMKIDTLLN